MKPEQVKFYLYADNDAQITELQTVLHEFVLEQYKSGKLVTAEGLIKAIKRLHNNPLISQFL